MQSASVQRTSSVKTLRSQLESMAMIKDQEIPGSSKGNTIDAEYKVDTNDDDDIRSNYDDLGTSLLETTPSAPCNSMPNNYFEFAGMNPFTDVLAAKDNTKSEYPNPNPNPGPNNDDKIVTRTLEVPAPISAARRVETMEETLKRLERELEQAHREIEEEQAAILQWLLMPLPSI